MKILDRCLPHQHQHKANLKLTNQSAKKAAQYISNGRNVELTSVDACIYVISSSVVWFSYKFKCAFPYFELTVIPLLVVFMSLHSIAK